LGPRARRLGTLSEPGGNVSLHKYSKTLLLGTLSHKKSAIFSFLMKSVPKSGVLVHLCTKTWRLGFQVYEKNKMLHKRPPREAALKKNAACFGALDD